MVVGGANSAGQAAIYFAGYAQRVTLLYRGDGLAKSMSRYLIDTIEATPNIDVRLQRRGRRRRTATSSLERITVRDTVTARRATRSPLAAMFVFIGARPQTDWLPDDVARDPRGFVLAGSELLLEDVRPRWRLDRDPYLLETSMPGVFVAGDVRSQSMKRVASAVGEGSMAVSFVHEYLAGRGMIELLAEQSRPVFEGVDDETCWRRSPRTGVEEHLAPGDAAVHRGQAGAERFFVIAEGTIEWSRCINGVDVILSERAGPTYFGAANLLTGRSALLASGRATTAGAPAVAGTCRHLPGVPARYADAR